MGSAIGIAAISIAIDHTRHRLPQPEDDGIVILEENGESAPCGLGTNPCGLTSPPTQED